MPETVKFYGIDILRFYWYVWQNNFVGVAWQTYVAYFIVCCCILALFVLGIMLFYNIKKRNTFQKKEQELDSKYHEKISFILCNYAKLENNEIIDILGPDYEQDIEEPKYFMNIITDIRTAHSDISYFPNMISLCSLLNVTQYCENNLLKNNNVFRTLQFLCINQIIIMEGRLANYVNHKDKDIRCMARLCYIMCAITNNYKYLKYELMEPSDMKFMLCHYIFEWMKFQKKKAPDFDTLISITTNEESIKFLQKEKEGIVSTHYYTYMG